MRGLALIGAVSVAAGVAACTPEPREIAMPDYENPQMSGQSGDQSGGNPNLLASAPVLDDAQIGRIVSGAQTALDEASENMDPEALKTRLTGPALALRTAEIIRAQKTGDVLNPLEIELNVASATVAETFPRTLLVGTSASKDDPAEVFLFVQPDAKSHYMMENWVRVVGGTTIRGVEVEDGSKPLGPDSEGFLVTPAEAVDAYTAFLRGEEVKVTFQDDVFKPAQADETSKLQKAVVDVGTITPNAAKNDSTPTGVTLSSGQGLISASFNTTIKYQRTVAKSKMKVGGTAAAYMDNTDVVGSVTANYLVNIFFLLPQEGAEEPIRIVGAERAIVSVDKNDAEKPEGEE
jgi:hypothetical protein